MISTPQKPTGLPQEPWSWDALQVRTALDTRQISALELTQICLARIDQVNPQINALPYVLHDEALAAARQADALLAKNISLPLLGIPVTTKVNVDQAGWPTTDGIQSLKHNIATVDSPPVARLKESGAVILGRSNTPAFSVRWYCENDLHGRTFNPINKMATPGGSSGGAAAALASGMCAIAHGNDYGGSIRYPAYACGVVGLRPSVGRVPAFNATAKSERGISGQLMSVQGALTRTVADAGLALEVLAQADARDPLWNPAPLHWPQENQSRQALKVAVFLGSSQHRVDRHVQQAIEQSAKYLQQAGYLIEEAEPPYFDEAAQLWHQLVMDDLRRIYPLMQELGDAAVRKKYQLFYQMTHDLDRDAYLALLARRLAVQRAWGLFFAKYPLMLTATAWQPPAPLGQDTESLSSLQSLLAGQAPMLATAALGLPGLSIPTAWCDTAYGRIPIGIQLCAWRYREDLLLQAGAAIEAQAQFDVLTTMEP